MTDRRNDTRIHARAKVSVSCAFGPTEDTPRSANVTSLSIRGCFVKTRAWAERGSEMFIRIWQKPERNWLTLRATVLYHMDKIGFGLRFDDVTPEQEEAIRAVMEEALRGDSPAEEGYGDSVETQAGDGEAV
ncbi:MAG TPA: PilZ domain-containing protein [Pyrinomonadaceae bacterium]